MSLEHWESFQREGALASFPTAPDGGYDPDVRRAWVEFFSSLPLSASLLDIGTGNGVIAQIAREYANASGRDWTIHASDLARIDPPKHLHEGAKRLQGIEFHAGVANERLPFGDGSFDAVSGHFALEYGESRATLREVFRVLRPGGNAQFVLHHADSQLVRAARQAMAEGDLVFKDTKIFRRLHTLVGMETSVPANASHATAELRLAIHGVKQAWQQARGVGGGRVLGVVLDAVQKLLEARKTQPAAKVAQEVERAEASVRASVRRMNDVVVRALDENGMQALEATARDVGFGQIERMPLVHGDQHLFAWQLLMARP